MELFHVDRKASTSLETLELVRLPIRLENRSPTHADWLWNTKQSQICHGICDIDMGDSIYLVENIDAICHAIS